MCSPSTPDYVGAAQAQGTANQEASLQTGMLSNPNVTNPYGTQRVTYTIDPTTGNSIPNINQTYSPSQQTIFDQGQQLQQQMGLLGLGAADVAKNTLGTQLDFNKSLGTQEQGRQSSIDAMMGRYDIDQGKAKQQSDADLIAAGIRPGTQAYATRADEFSRGRNDALQQATIGADQQAQQSRQQAITELLAQRQTPLNEISAFRSGSQITPLSFGSVGANQVQAAPIYGANQAQSNFDQASAQGQQTAAVGVVSALAMAY